MSDGGRGRRLVVQFLAKALALAALLFTGAIFGFFYAWVCSTMWGLDATDPRIAIQAMQAMNESVRNPVFAPAFFATPIVCLLAAGAAHFAGATRAGLWIAVGGVIYVAGGLLPTVAVNVPMNQALAAVDVPESIEAARAIWQDYSPRWQDYNIARTIGSGLALVSVGIGLLRLGRA